MRYLGTILAALLLFTSCKDDPIGPDIDEFEAYKVGAWYVNSPITANWEGLNAKGDTTTITKSSDHQIEIEDDTSNVDGAFFVSFIDSTIKYGVNDVDVSRTELSIDSDGIIVSGGAQYLTEHYYQGKFNLIYECNGLSSVKDLEFAIYSEDGSHYRTYQFRADGFSSVIKDIVRCN